MATAFVGLGANLGDRAATLRDALRRLEALGRVSAVSSLYETEPVGFREQPPFLNAVVVLQTERSAVALVRGLLGIERDMGRVRTFRNAPRTLDLDLLLVDDLVLDAPGLTLPHPRLHERAFVLVPLAEIAPVAIHPLLRKTALELLAALPDQSGISLWAAPGWESSSNSQKHSPTGTIPPSPVSDGRLPPPVETPPPGRGRLGRGKGSGGRKGVGG